MKDTPLEIVLELPIRCKPQPRPRVTRNGTFDPNKLTKIAIALLVKAKLHLYDSCGVDFPTDHLVVLDVVTQFRTPKKSKIGIPLADVDNLLKTVMDSLTGVVYDDDRQVKRATLEKCYGPEDQVKIALTVLKPRSIEPAKDATRTKVQSSKARRRSTNRRTDASKDPVG
jgi:Holliday junction resolvase RusA-like endonuclease